jgi:hypothetical protein
MNSMESLKCYETSEGNFIAKYKDAFSGRRISKTLPVSLNNLQEAKDWSTNWLTETLSRANLRVLNEEVVLPPQTINTLIPKWEAHHKALPDAEPKAIESTANCIRKWGKPINDVVLQDLSVPKCPRPS